MIVDPRLEMSVEKSLHICDELGIPYSRNIREIKVNNRITTKWGYCKIVGLLSPSTGGITENRIFDIHIAGILLKEDITEKQLLSVLLHEILHTCPGCFNHGRQWKAYKKLIKKNTGIKIYKVASTEDMDMKPHYYIKCQKCGTKTKYPMRPRHVKRRCLVCGSKKFSCFYKEKEKGKQLVWED